MRFISAIILCSLVLVAGCDSKREVAVVPTVPHKQVSRDFGKLERIDPRFDRLVPVGAMFQTFAAGTVGEMNIEDLPMPARLELLAEGLDWSEGPVWVPNDKCLLFSDVPQNTVYKLKDGKGISIFMKPSGYTGSTPRDGEPGSNGLTLDREGRLVLCEHGDRRVARVEKNGTKTTLADKYNGKRFNSPNDLCYDSKGNLFFTDPPYGLIQNWKDPARELDFCGVYRLSNDGKLTLLTGEMTRPNGIALSPDEKTLYVAQSDGEKPIWMAFDLKEDGTIANGRVFFDSKKIARKGLKGGPDGMKVDREGNLFCTGPGGICVFAPDGTFLGRIHTGEQTGNCCWGDDGSTLYICADMFICRIKTTTKGKGW